jgi:hypothetical protein
LGGVGAGLSVLSALAGLLPWHELALGSAGQPAALLAMAAVSVSVAVLLSRVLATSARAAASSAAIPQTSRAARLRAKAWRACFIPQRDPDAAGRPRPRAPGASPAAA